MAKRILLLGDALISARLIEALRSQFDGEVVHVGTHVGIQMEAGVSQGEARRVLDGVAGSLSGQFVATFEPAAMDRFIHRVTLRDIEPCMPVLAFDRDRFDRPYGKNARRQLRGGRHD